ncbi:MAG: hypothetical protein RJB34_498 [Pseudomonadota bacterium]|jgi:hypothetical protein
MWEKISDIPVIIQGALGSFLFWLCYTAIAKLTSATSNLVGRYNSSWRRETLMFEQMQAKFMLTVAEQRVQYLLLCLYGALNRLIQALIYLCLGLVANVFLGPIAVVAYGFSVIYLFRAMRAVYLQVSDGKTQEWYASRIKEIDEELARLDGKKDA